MGRHRLISFALAGTFLSMLAGSPVFSAVDSGTWHLLAGPMDPPPMYGHAAIRDPARHRMLFIDGAHPEVLWSLSLSEQGRPQWTRIPVGGTEYPGGRHCFSAVLDSTEDRVLVFGGYLEWMSDYGDTWALSLADPPRWTRILATGESPHSRWKHAAVFDPVRQRMVVFGGYSYTAGQLADTWALELSDDPVWHRLAAGGRAPLHREGPGAVYDPWNDRMVMFGGWVFGDITAYPPQYYISDETWSLSLADPVAWDSLALPLRAGPRQMFATALDTEHRTMIVSGGEGWQDGHQQSDTWALRLDGLPEWTLLPTSGAGPGGIAWHAGAFAPERGSFVQYGGTWTAAQSQCYELDLSTDRWARVYSPAPDPRPLSQGGAVFIPDPMAACPLLVGGVGRHDLWSFDESGPSWTRLATDGTTTATWIAFDARRRRLLAIGGGIYINRGGMLDDIWSLSLDEPRVWTKVTAQGPTPAGRTSFGLMADPARDRLLLYGGLNYGWAGSRQANDLGDVWELSLADLRWRRLAVEAAPGRRGAAHLLLDPARDRMLLLGGIRSGYATSFPILDTWYAPLGDDSLQWIPLGASLPADGAVVLDPVHDRLLLWWGDQRVSSLSLANPLEWVPMRTGGTSPTARFASAVGFDPHADRLLVYGGGVFGGFPSYSDAGDFYALDLSRRVKVVVRPGHDLGKVEIGRPGLVEAAILATADFAPDSLLPGAVTLGGVRAVEDMRGPVSALPQDVDRDGRTDLILWFPTDSMKLDDTDSVLVLLGETPSGAIFGRAPVSTVEGRASRAIHPHTAPTGPTHRLSVWSERTGSSGLSMHWELPAGSPARLEVFDVSGRRVFERELPSAERTGTLRLPAGALSPGVFLLRLSQESRQVTSRAIVLR